MKNVLRPKEAANYLSVSLATLWRIHKKRDFPKKVRLSAKSVGWLESDIAEWLEKQKTL